MSEEVKTEETAEAVETAGTEAAAAPSAGAKVPMSTRVIGGVIDGVVAGVAAGIVTTVLGFVHVGIATVIGQVVTAGYWLLRDSILGNGQSVGKKVMKYRVVDGNGEPVSQELSIKRNVTLAAGSVLAALVNLLILIPGIGTVLAILATPIFLVIPVIFLAELYFVYSDPKGNRYGDKLAGTTTVAFTE